MRVVSGLVLTGSLNLPALANPQGGTVAEGAATIVQSGNRVDIHQSTDRAVIDWRSFSIAPGEITQFHQPSASSIALNRVTGADPSHIFGTLRANGRVFLINPNGIMFGAGSRVDVSGLVATTSDIRNQDFMAGRMEFSIPSSNPGAAVVNEGEISIADAGYAALVAPHVRNSGVINARLGRVTLGAADAFAVDLYGDELVTFRVGVGRTPVDADGKPVDSLVDNQGRILAGGGIVRLAAHNVEAVVRNVINTDGVIYANTIERRGGRIILGATGAGAVTANGELSAEGGSVAIAGDGDVSLNGTRITASDVAVAADTDGSGAGDLNAGATGGDSVLTDIDIDTASGGADGGRVVVTGDRVAILGASTIDASGAAGGGEILIGGDFQGNGATRNADTTIVGEGVQLKADALDTGDGGRVILWADGYTRFHGSISAVAGLTAGNGGFAEVSGKQNLDFRGSVDVTAAAGEIGTLLLDPVDILISADDTDTATGSSLGNILFADAPGVNPWNVSPTALDAVNGNILLQASNDITISSAVSLSTAGATFTATANNDINVNADLTTNNAAIVLTADANGSGLGDLTVAGGFTVTSGSNSVTVSANDLNLAGSIDSGTGTTTILVSDGGAVLLGGGGSGDMTIAVGELQNITATNLIVGDATNGNITIKNVGAANSDNIGTVTLNATKAGSTVDFLGAGGVFNALVINADALVSVKALTTDTGGLTINAANGVTLTDNVTTSGATVIDADSDNNGSGTFTVNATFALNTSGNTLSITADDIDVSGTINSGAAATTILISDGGTIGLGATAGNLTITGAELLNITATGLTIGDATNGNITVDGITAANSNNISGTLTLNATKDNASITFSGTDSTFNGIAANADDGITVGVDISTDVGGLALEGDADNAADTNDNITFVAGTTIASFGNITLDATTGGMTGAGALTLNARSGLTVNDSLTTAGATVMNADTNNNGSSTFTLAAGAAIVTGNNTLSITADKMAVSGTLNSGTQSTTLLASNGAAINLGSATDAAPSTVELSNAELQSITASGLTIGDATAGAITVSADVTPGATAGAGVTTLNLVSGSTVTATAGGIVETSLSVVAAGAVTFSDATTDIDTIAIDTSTGNVAYTDADGFTVGTVGTIKGIDTASGSVTLVATTGNITVSNSSAANDIGATTAISLTASADNAAITIQAGTDVESTGGAHTYTADDIEITGTVTATGQTVTLASTTAGDAVDVGDPGGGGDNVANTLELAGAEIQNITAANLTIGGSAAGNMTVDGITAANSNNISGTVTLTAGGNGSTLTFQNTASTFNALSANADDRLAVNVDVTTDTGNLSITADADDTADTNDDAVIAAGATLTSAGSLTLAAKTGGITGSGALNLTAKNGLTLSNAFTGSGNAVFNADSDGNSSGNFAATTINVGANSLNITGASVNAGTSVTAGATTLNGTVTGSGLTVASLTLTGASATLTGTTVGGQTGSDAATATTMPDAATHTVNGCEKNRCVVAVVEPTTADLDAVQVDTGGSTGDTGGGATGGDTGGNTGGDTGGDAGGDSGGETSGSDTSGGDTTTGGDTPAEDTSGGSTSGGETTSTTGSGSGDSAGGATGGESGGGWTSGSFNPASGDLLLTESVGNFQVFFELLKEEGAKTLELLEASEKLENSELASLVKALGEILGEYEFVSTAIPTNAFDDKATTLLPGLLTFEPAVGNAADGSASPASGGYKPPSFGRFQF